MRKLTRPSFLLSKGSFYFGGNNKNNTYLVNFLFSLFLVLPYLVLFLAPEVVLNATASVINETSIRAWWEIGSIHPRLRTPDTYQVSYCPHCRWKPCLATNISTSAGNLTTLVSGLLVGVTYTITVRAINVTARDGTPVETPYGEYSKPVYNTTHEGGGWSLICLTQARIEGQREETSSLDQSSPWDMLNFTKVISRQF